MSAASTRVVWMVVAAWIAACSSESSPPIPCNVEGGACAPGSLCVHVCDCCGIDAGLPPSGHDLCVPETSQCGQPFQVEGRACTCVSETEAACPCA